MKRSEKLIGIAVLFAATGLGAFIGYGLVFHDSHWLEMVLGGYIWDGSFKTNMRIQSRSSQAVHHVSCAFASRRGEAEWYIRSDCDEEDAFRPVKEFDGTNALAFGRCSARYWLGVEYGYSADRFVVLRIDYGNGKQLRTVAELPRVRGPRNVTVEIP
jgi:hypothetical protein